MKGSEIMGGRGASSSKSISYKNSKPTTAKSLQKEIENVSNKMLKYAQYATPAYTGADKQSKSKKYYEYQRQYRALKKEMNEIDDKKANNKTKSTPKPKLKGRKEWEVTSQTYERAQKRLNKDVNNWFGRGM
jgi:hypothetical protein